MITPILNVPSYPCPKCGGRMDVKDSRPTTVSSRKTVRRRRRCNRCSFAISTVELPAERAVSRVLLSAQRLKNAAQDLINALSDAEEPQQEAAE